VSKEYLARGISDYLTSETGVHVVFESAIVPKWRDSRICFQNVYISRRSGRTPGEGYSGDDGHKEASRLLNLGEHHDDFHDVKDDESHVVEVHDAKDDEELTYFDINIDSVAVTLSLWRWLDGRGLITDAEVHGVRGVIGA